MSIIVTQISQNGIIHAADSNLTNSLGQASGQAKKLFPIKRFNAALTVSGNYIVRGKMMDEWMSEFIDHNKSKDLKNFVKTLTDSLNKEAQNNEKQIGYDLHVAGYVGNSVSSHPEFYHITNYSIDGTTGNYSVKNPTLRFTEDFWKENQSVPTEKLFANHTGYIYCNGFPSGRIIYFEYLKRMSKFRSFVWAKPDWGFRLPASVDEEVDYLKHDMELITLFFKQSNYSAPFIGGDIDTYTIKCPKQIV